MDVSSGIFSASVPPLRTVIRLQAELAGLGIHSVIGGSGLLASLGLTGEVHDWDLVIDAEPGPEHRAPGEPDGVVHAVERVLREMGLPHRRRARSGIFHTSAAILVDAGDHSIDVLIGFALEAGEGSGKTVVAIPARPGGRWQGLQMARVEDWELAYRLMGRADRAAALQRHLDA